MILSVSRRTDIPAFYSEWFLNRVRAGFVDVRNPMNYHQVSRIKINPEIVDCIVFWSKNPKPLLSKLDQLKDYNYYFQFTINPYDKSLETGVSKKNEVITGFKRLSDLIGPDRVIWRYDPILLTEKIDVKYHAIYFKELARRLEGYTHNCVISFVDLYKKTLSNTKELLVREPTIEEMKLIAENISQISSYHNITVESCSEKIDLFEYGIAHGHCIDQRVIERLCGYPVDVKKDSNQRKECGCIESVDIGAYNTCAHGCKYCYANFSEKKVTRQSHLNDVDSSLLVGKLSLEDKVNVRTLKSLRSSSLF